VAFCEAAEGGVALFATKDTAAFAVEDVLDDIDKLLRPVVVVGVGVVGEVIQGANTRGRLVTSHFWEFFWRGGDDIIPSR
jgi:hypothetical protein